MCQPFRLNAPLEDRLRFVPMPLMLIDHLEPSELDQVQFPDRIYLLRIHLRLLRKSLPLLHTRLHLIDDRLGLLDVHVLRYCKQISARDVQPLPVDAHLVLFQPDAAGVVREGHVVGGGEVPLALRIHQEGDVLRVVVVVARDGDEAHAAEELRRSRVGQA